MAICGINYFWVSFFFSASSNKASLKPNTTDAMRLCAVSAWPKLFSFSFKKKKMKSKSFS